jgi:hypothetical protein
MQALKSAWMSLCSQVTFHEQDVKAPDSITPLQTFEVDKQVMFVDEATFENKDLLQILTPPSPYDMDKEDNKPTKAQHDD